MFKQQRKHTTPNRKDLRSQFWPSLVPQAVLPFRLGGLVPFSGFAPSVVPFLGGLGAGTMQSNFHSDAVFGGFSWHAPAPLFDTGKTMLFQYKNTKPRQCAAELGEMELHPGAVFVPWKKPANFKAGWAWFKNRLEILEGPDPDTKVGWKVVGHVGAYTATDPYANPSTGSRRTSAQRAGASPGARGERPSTERANAEGARGQQANTERGSAERVSTARPRQALPVSRSSVELRGVEGPSTALVTDVALREASCLAVPAPPLSLLLVRGWRALVDRGTGWSLGEVLGEGTHGTVRACRAAGGAAVAVKSLKNISAARRNTCSTPWGRWSSQGCARVKPTLFRCWTCSALTALPTPSGAHALLTSSPAGICRRSLLVGPAPCLRAGVARRWLRWLRASVFSTVAL